MQLAWKIRETVKRWNGETVKRWNGETVKRWNGETVKRWNGETVKRWRQYKSVGYTRTPALGS